MTRADAAHAPAQMACPCTRVAAARRVGAPIAARAAHEHASCRWFATSLPRARALRASVIALDAAVSPTPTTASAAVTARVGHVHGVHVPVESGSEVGGDVVFPPNLTPSAAYDYLVQHGKVRRDERQVAALQHLDALYKRVTEWVATEGEPGAHTSAPHHRSAGASTHAPTSSWSFMSMFKPSRAPGAPGGASAPAAVAGAPDIPGLYMYGGTGCGKTFMMDLFYRCIPVHRKRRVHFHSFMLDVHERLHAARKHAREMDIVASVAAAISARSWLICFDEMQVTDIGDAMILQRLFASLWEAGVVVVITSNRPPTDLYKNGLQRELFMPFIKELQGRCTVHNMDSSTDYRKLCVPVHAGDTWLSPETRPTSAPHAPSLRASMDAVWNAHTASELGGVAAVQLTTQGRQVHVPRAHAASSSARFTFADLCEKPLYAADYQVIAQSFAHVFIDDIPRLTLGNRNELRRFITLIDTLYDHHVKLVACAPHGRPPLGGRSCAHRTNPENGEAPAP
ncbi:cell division protein ZapE, partial [archaeon]